MAARFEDRHFGMDVAALFDRLFDGVERFMGAKAQAVRIVNERIAGDARLFVVRLAESAVDDDEFALRLDGVFAQFGAHGHVPVDDVAVFARDAEIAQHFFAELLSVAVYVIAVVLLFMELRVVDVQPFKRGDLFAPVQRRTAAAPEIPEEVFRLLVVPARVKGAVSPAHERFAVIEQVAPFVSAEVHVTAVFVEGHAAVEDQIVVADLIGGPVADEKRHVAGQLFAGAEGTLQPVDNLALGGGKAERVGRVDPRERNAVEPGAAELPFRIVDVFQDIAAFHTVFGAAFDDLPFRLELH